MRARILAGLFLLSLHLQLPTFAQTATAPNLAPTEAVIASPTEPTTVAPNANAIAPRASYFLTSLFDSDRQLPLDEPLGVLTLPRNKSVTPDDLLKEPYASQFKPRLNGAALPTSELQDVWLRLQLPVQNRPQSWMLRVPRLNLEKATLFQSPSSQQPSLNATDWQQQSAGTDLPRSSWAVRARDPIFEVSTRSDQTQVLFIRLQNRKAITEEIQLIHSTDFGNGANHAGTLNGLIIGVFSMLTLICLLSWRINRNSHFGWLALTSVMLLFSQLTLSGYMFMRVWPDSVLLAKTSSWVLPLLGLATLARFAISASYARDLSKPVYWVLWTLIALCGLISVGIFAMPQEFPREPLNAVYAAGMLAIIGSLSWIAWRSQSWLWVIVASLLPITLSSLARLAYNLGWVAQMEIALLGGVISAAIGFVGIYAALVNNQRQRVASVQIDDVSESTDVPTGLFNERIARARMPQIILRSKRSNNACGSILVRWIGSEDVMASASTVERGRIFAHLGSRLARLARDIDTVARFGDDQFLFLIEAPVSREQLNALASKILSTCLRPSPALPEGRGFEVHLAVWLSSEMPANATSALELLKTRINQMREGTQRRVQFVNTPLSTAPSQEQSDPDYAKKLIAKINDLEATHGLPTISLKPK